MEELKRYGRLASWTPIVGIALSLLAMLALLAQVGLGLVERPQILAGIAMAAMPTAVGVALSHALLRFGPKDRYPR